MVVLVQCSGLIWHSMWNMVSICSCDCNETIDMKNCINSKQTVRRGTIYRRCCEARFAEDAIEKFNEFWGRFRFLAKSAKMSRMTPYFFSFFLICKCFSCDKTLFQKILSINEFFLTWPLTFTLLAVHRVRDETGLSSSYSPTPSSLQNWNNQQTCTLLEEKHPIF